MLIDGAVTVIVWQFTTTLKLHIAFRTSASVAVQVTSVVPKAKLLFEAGVQVTVALPQLSVAVGDVYVTTAPAAEVNVTGGMVGQLLSTGD